MKRKIILLVFGVTLVTFISGFLFPVFGEARVDPHHHPPSHSRDRDVKRPPPPPPPPPRHDRHHHRDHDKHRDRDKRDKIIAGILIAIAIANAK